MRVKVRVRERERVRVRVRVFNRSKCDLSVQVR